jgi:hypothetical protein
MGMGASRFPRITKPFARSARSRAPGVWSTREQQSDVVSALHSSLANGWLPALVPLFITGGRLTANGWRSRRSARSITPLRPARSSESP